MRQIKLNNLSTACSVKFNSASRCIDDDQMALCFSCQSPFQGEINQYKDSLYDLAAESRICV